MEVCVKVLKLSLLGLTYKGPTRRRRLAKTIRSIAGTPIIKLRAISSQSRQECLQMVQRLTAFPERKWTGIPEILLKTYG